MLTLEDFVRESNAIEGILRDPDVREITATKDFLEKKTLSVASMELLVFAYAPHAVLRNKRGLDVRVGNHIAISGSPWVEVKLRCLLEDAMNRWMSPWQVHCEYEKLHPFTDGNGRSGRALWLWMMGDKGLQLPFLHRFYYQTLENFR